ncbi:hypothetical protein GCM10010423_34930 [Streptomyces levis]|uniref:Uncharacterized protein n=1 Tax=Streptomyces levis TaxID=285566 RepID=A0ABN3NUC2_9ACTN
MGLAPSDTQNISTLDGVGSHPFFPQAGGPAEPSVAPPRINACRFTYQPRTGTRFLLTRRSGSTAGCGTLVSGRLYDPWREYLKRLRAAVPRQEFEGALHRELRHASTPVGRPDRGNQPIDRRVDTISKQYQASGPQGSTQDGSDGGGAPWES